MLVSTNIGKHISKPKKGEFLYNFFPGEEKRGNPVRRKSQTGGILTANSRSSTGLDNADRPSESINKA